MNVLHLTSPQMRGSNVANAQYALKENVFEQDFAPGKMDGHFGEATARACKRAKYWLGYPDRKQLPSFGDELRAYLKGERKLPPAYKLRRQARLKAKPEIPLRIRALANLRNHLGEKENPPGSNRISWASDWYGIRGPWCAMSVSRAYVDAGSKAFKRGERYAYVPYIVADARAGRNNLAVTNKPQAGDLVCFDWDGDGVADHVGLYEKAGKGSAFTSIEGNTGIGDDSNGGEVMRRERNRSQVQAFVHVGT